ncbi:C-type lectin domain family 4 member K [Erinaceus europaeus]|uniref:C-type lectin domain family 4 member K n=1 Tax=Erinaceus europaeus TaxID=9365 RepID=A0A1S2ZSA5_ERIEU|nr:C-type lectin domain family 4 member K [Erinaceus europaeus]
MIFLMLVLAASILVQAVLYPFFMGTISDIKANVRLLEGCVVNVSTLDTAIKRNRGNLEATSFQVQVVNGSLNQQLRTIQQLKNAMMETRAQIQMLINKWEQVRDLDAQIPELRRDLEKGGALSTKIQELQNSVESIGKLLKYNGGILQMVSKGWMYFHKNFYYFSHIAKTWYSAQQFCVSKNSHLTSVTSESEQEFLYKAAGGFVYWIGLTKAGSEGSWTWVDDTPFNKAQSARYWIPGEPNNYESNEQCVSLKIPALQGWNDNSCDDVLRFICKKPYTPSEL